MTQARRRDLIKPDDRAVFRRLAPGSGGVVLHLETAGYYSLNEVGCALWEALRAEGSTVEDLDASLRRLYPDAPEDASADIQAFIGELHERGLVQVVES